jgi:hypothetical protein
MVDNYPKIVVLEKLQVIFLCKKIGLLIHSNVRCQELCIYESVDNENYT